jgi:hypothetical protein
VVLSFSEVVCLIVYHNNPRRRLP